ncbi:MAG: T9SS type A sorting domain-containing protein [Ignavibacteria bacterium]|nr:T9SS type A sorting domain-containing protein [Ignavibacteria bacterium]
MKTARLFLALFALGLVGATPAFAQGTPPWEYWQDVNAPVTDFSTTTSVFNITDAFTIANMQVMVDIQHTAASDLLITLQSPIGNFVLSQYNGSVYDNYENTIFDPVVNPMPCSGSVPAGSALPGIYVNEATNQTAYFRGVYRPQPGTVFPTGGSPIGTWTIQVLDNAGGDVGVLRRWALIFNRYGFYKDVRIGWDINYRNKCGQPGSRMPSPFTDDQTMLSLPGFYPVRTLGYRPLGGSVYLGTLIQNSKTASETQVTYQQRFPDNSTPAPAAYNLNLPLGQFVLGNIIMLPTQTGNFRVTTSLYQRGDLFSSRLDNTDAVNTALTPGSLGYDGGTSAQTYNNPLNDCEANVFALAQEQMLTSIDVWQGTNVELEPANSAARVEVKVWDASSGAPAGIELYTTGPRSLPVQGGKWVSYDFTPPVTLPAGTYAFGICASVAATTGGVGLGLDQEGSPFDINGLYSRYYNTGVEFFSQNNGGTWSPEFLRQFGGKMIRPNFVTGSDVGVIAILNPPASLPSSFTPRVRFGSFANHPLLPNAVTFGKVSITNNATNAQVYYSERRVWLQNAPYIADVDFDNFSVPSSGSYTIKAWIERADDENLINNSYSRQYVKAFAPIAVSHRGTLDASLRNTIETSMNAMGLQARFVDRTVDGVLPEEGQILWIGTLTTTDATAARAFVKAGNTFMVLPTREFAGDVLSNVFASVATSTEQQAITATASRTLSASRPEFGLTPDLAAMATHGNAAAMILSKDMAERESAGARVSASIVELQNRLAVMQTLPVGDIAARPMGFSSSDDVMVEGLRFGDLTVAQLVARKSIAPRPVVESFVNPDGFELTQNYPNPFNPTTNIAYNLPTDAQVIVRIYDMLGRQVSMLVNSSQTAGKYIVTWNGQNEAREVMPSGIYLYRMDATAIDGSASFSTSRKMILSK